MILLIDNYDSFTYNLYQYIGEFYQGITVRRNDNIGLDEIEEMRPKYIVISPGPGHPRNAGITVNAIQRFSGRIPILGICLGHQSIALAMGGTVELAQEVVHGKQSEITHNGGWLFKGIPSNFKVVRYHSLCVGKEDLPQCLEVQASSKDGTVMALRHKFHLTFGVQFHPESILTEYGKTILKNFLQI